MFPKNKNRFYAAVYTDFSLLQEDEVLMCTGRITVGPALDTSSPLQLWPPLAEKPWNANFFEANGGAAAR